MAQRGGGLLCPGLSVALPRSDPPAFFGGGGGGREVERQNRPSVVSVSCLLLRERKTSRSSGMGRHPSSSFGFGKKEVIFYSIQLKRKGMNVS